MAMAMLVLAGCAAPPPAADPAAGDALVVPPPDAWEGLAADLPDQQLCEPVPAALVAPVQPSRREEAVERLRQVAIVPLSAAQAAELAPRAAGAAAGGAKPYLVRATAKNEATGVFYAQVCGGALWISHHSLGRDIPPSVRLPVVVFLDRPPTRLFVSVGMAM
jgi:hypothetical protein